MNPIFIRGLGKSLPIFLIAFAILSFQNCYGQAEAESENILLLQHTTKEKTRYISAGSKVAYRVKAGETRKGQLDKITDSTFTISGNTYYPEELEMISGKSTGLKQAKIGGAIALVVGAGSTFAGVALLKVAQDASNCGEAFWALMFGVLLAAAGFVLVIAGFIPLFIRNKRYNLGSDWQLSITRAISKSNRKSRS